MVPVPPLDGGNVLMGVLPPSGAALVERLRPFGFILLYALMLTGVLSAILRPGATLRPGLAAVTDRQRVVSGMRPTGKLHLGHLVGRAPELGAAAGRLRLLLLRRRLARAHQPLRRHQRTSSPARSTTSPTGSAPASTRSKSAFFVQSMVPEHAELYLLLQMVTPIPWLERVPTYKEQMEQLAEKDLVEHRLSRLPAAADRRRRDLRRPLGAGGRRPGAAPRAVARGRAPVQQFLLSGPEGARPGLVEPQALLTPTSRLPGPRQPEDEQELRRTPSTCRTTRTTVRQKVRQMYTDPKRVRADIPGTVEGNPVFIYHDAFNPNRDEVDDLKARYRAGKVGDVEVKTKLATAINADARADSRTARRRAGPARLYPRGAVRGLGAGPARWPKRRWSGCATRCGCGTERRR